MAQSWHWEDTNYCQWLTQKYHQLFSQFQWTSPSVTIHLVDPTTINGSGSILLRRDKPIASCCFDVHVNWRGMILHDDDGADALPADDINRSASGTLRLHEIDIESLQNDIDVEVSCSSDDALHRRIKQNIVTGMMSSLTQRIRQDVLTPFLKEETSRVAQAKQSRRALGSVGPLTGRGDFQQQPQHNGGSEEASSILCNSDDAIHSIPTAPPSLLNHGESQMMTAKEDITKTVFWEERNLTAASLSELQKRLEGISKGNAIQCMNGECALELFDVQVTGDAVRSLRKGNRFTIYEFHVGCSWRAITRNAAGVFLADAKGRLDVVSFSSEDLDELSIDSSCDDSTHPARERIYEAIKREGTDTIKRILLQFVQDLVSA